MFLVMLRLAALRLGGAAFEGSTLSLTRELQRGEAIHFFAKVGSILDYSEVSKI